MIFSRTSALARTERSRRTPRASSMSTALVRAIAIGVAATLAIDAYVHATSAAIYDPPHAGLLTEGNLFRVEAAVSALLALLVLVRPSRWTFAPALAVAATAVGAVVLYRYVNVGAIGPLPNLYEPTWQVPGKLASAFAEGIAVLLSAAGLTLTRRALQSMRAASPPLAAVAQVSPEPSAAEGSRETRRTA